MSFLELKDLHFFTFCVSLVRLFYRNAYSDLSTQRMRVDVLSNFHEVFDSR